MTCMLNMLFSSHSGGQSLAAREAGNITSCVALFPGKTPGVQLPQKAKIRMAIRKRLAEVKVLWVLSGEGMKFGC